jgi:3-hydroxyisobutyrate dehydrogenase
LDSAGQRVGVAGLGNMGGRITRRLLGAGLAVTGFDPRPGAVASTGAAEAESLAALVLDSDVVLLSLPDSNVVEDVVAGPGGIMSAARAGLVVIDLSTAAPASTTRLHARLAQAGVVYLDVGISGGAAAAEAGTLTLMTGGPSAVLDQLHWLFEPIAARVFHMGPSGAGHSAKLLNNFLNAVSLAATAEVMIAGKKAGLDLARLLEVINHSSGVNFATLNRFPSIIRGDYLEGGLTNALMTKDVALYVDYVRGLGVPSLNAAGPLASFGLANSLGYADRISNTVVDALGDLAGGTRLTDSAEESSQEG